MANKKQVLFVVSETQFSYNDEVYSVEGDGGTPLNAFHNEEDAKKFISEATVKWLKDLGPDCLANHGYNIRDIFKRAPDFLPQEEQDTFFDGDDYAFDILNRPSINWRSTKHLKKMGEALAFSPFTLHKVTVE